MRIGMLVAAVMAAGCMSGCAVYGPPSYAQQPVYQAPPAYAQPVYPPQPVYVQPAPVYVAPPVSFGLDLDFLFGGHRGWRGGYRHGWH